MEKPTIPQKKVCNFHSFVTLKQTAETDLADVITKNTTYNNKANKRISAFSGLKSLATRLVNALQTTEASKETIDDAKTFTENYKAKKHPIPNHQPVQIHLRYKKRNIEYIERNMLYRLRCIKYPFRNILCKFRYI